MIIPASPRAIIEVAGTQYSGWTSLEISRSVERCASHFEVQFAGDLPEGAAYTTLMPFAPVRVLLGTQLLLSGYIDEATVNYAAHGHSSRLIGRSRTAQMVDCMPDVPSGQYVGYSLAAIARALGGLFGVDVIVQTTLADAPLADTTMQRMDTAFRFLDRLAAVSGVLLCDDETGALILTTAGAGRASGRLVQGQNIMSARLEISGAGRYSQYIVKGQRGIVTGGGGAGWSAGANGAVQIAPTTGSVVTQQRAVANDASVPLFRPHVTMAESQLTQAQMQIRADWQRGFAYGKSLRATVTVPGWLQPDGEPWTANQIVPITSAWLGLDQDVLIYSVRYRFSVGDGQVTELTLGPVEGIIPSPSLLNATYRKGLSRKRGTAYSWDGVSPGPSP